MPGARRSLLGHLTLEGHLRQFYDHDHEDVTGAAGDVGSGGGDQASQTEEGSAMGEHP